MGILSGYRPDFSEANPTNLLSGNPNPMAVDRMGLLSGALQGAAARKRASMPGPDPTWFQDVGRGYGGDLGGMVGGLLAPPDLNTGDPMADGMNAASIFGMPGVGMVKSAMPIKAYHAAFSPFDKYDWKRLGESTLENQTGGAQEKVAMNLARLGPWASEKELAARMAVDHSLPVEIGGRGKAFASLEKLNEYIRKAGGPKAARKKLTDAGYGHAVVQDEEFGGKSYIALSPEHFTIKP